jgi:ribonuclease P protein component
MNELKIKTLKSRKDFIRVFKEGISQPVSSFILQKAKSDFNILNEDKELNNLVRVGFTASKKIGNAILRNRAKRRLRALVREMMPDLADSGYDYVLVARPNSLKDDFSKMKKDFAYAIKKLKKGI